MSRSDWERKVDFMRGHGAIEAVWSQVTSEEEDDVLVSLKLAPTAPRPAQPAAAAPPGPAAKLAEAMAARRQREHEIRFAASHHKPRLDLPVTENQVPRAVLDKSVADGRASSNRKRR